jgi:hypothetical protein
MLQRTRQASLPPPPPQPAAAAASLGASMALPPPPPPLPETPGSASQAGHLDPKQRAKAALAASRAEQVSVCIRIGCSCDDSIASERWHGAATAALLLPTLSATLSSLPQTPLSYAAFKSFFDAEPTACPVPGSISVLSRVPCAATHPICISLAHAHHRPCQLYLRLGGALSWEPQHLMMPAMKENSCMELHGASTA